MSSAPTWLVRGIRSAIVVACATQLANAGPSASPPSIVSQKVSIEAEDGVLIAGDYYAPVRRTGETAPIIILLHMEGSDRSAWRPLVPPLHAAGLAVLSIDLRGHGESVEPKGFNLAKKAADRDSRLYRAMYKDVAAAYLWLVEQKQVDPARFALVGAGFGASVALDYAARDRSVDAIVCLSPSLNYPGLDSVASIRKCDSRALLLLAGKADGDAATELQRAVGRATLKLLPDIGGGGSTSPRGTDMLGRAKDLEQTIVTFVDRSLGRPATDPVVASTNSEVYHVPGTSHTRRIKDENRRWFSSAAEAEARGLRAVKKRASRGSGEARQAGPKAPTAPSPTGRGRSSGSRTGTGE